MAVLRFLIGLIVTILIALLAVLNRGDASFTWSPIHDSLTLPIYIIILGSMAAGFIFGGAIVWLNAGKLRKEKRKQKKYIKRLEKDVERLKDQKLTSSSPATDIFPALPAK